MATEKEFTITLSSVDRQWILKSLDTQRQVLVRSRNKEFSGSEIHNLRTREIDQLIALIGRF